MKQLVLTPRGNVPLESLKKGDEVIGKSEQGNYETYIVSNVDKFTKGKRGSKKWIVINGHLTFADHQSIYVNGKLRHAFQVKVGDRLETSFGSHITVKNIEVISDTREKIKLHIDAKRSWLDRLFRRKKTSSHTYFLNGILVHNASRYWVGNGGNWTGTTHWASSSGGASGASEPTSSDDANFDANSFSSTGQSVTIGAASAGNCAAWNCSAVTNNPNFNLSNYLFTHGNITFGTMTTTNTSGFFLQVFGSGSYNINFNGVLVNWNITFNDVGTYTLTGALLATNSSTRVLIQGAGTLNFNGQVVTVHNFTCDGSSNVRTLNMGSSVVTCDTWNPDGTNLTLNAGTSTLDINSGGSFSPNSKTYNIVKMQVNGSAPTVTCSNFMFKNGSSVSSISNITATTLTFYQNTTANSGFSITNLTITKDAGNYDGPTVFQDDITVSGTFTAQGISQTDRVFIMGKDYGSEFRGQKVKITAAVVSISNVDFQLISGLGAGTWSGTSIGNMGGNSGITFTAGVTRYWVGNGGDWNDTSHWSASSGGSSGASMPLPQDTVLIDSASFSSAGQTITISDDHFTAFDASGVLHTPEIAISNSNGNVWIRGATLRFAGTNFNPGSLQILHPCPDTGNDMTVYSGGLTIPCSFYVNGIETGTVFLGDDMIIDDTDGDFELVSGQFDANDFNLTTPYFYNNWDSKTDVDFGKGTLRLKNAAYQAELDFNNTVSQHAIHAEESHIIFDAICSSGRIRALKNRFHDITSEISGEFNIWGGCEIDSLVIKGTTPTVFFEDTQYFLIHDLHCESSAGNVVTIQSLSSGSPAFLITDKSPLVLDYISLQDIHGISGPILDTGYKSPTATANDSEDFGPWANTDNIKVSDNTYSTNAEPAGNTGWLDEILGSGFDFSAIPDDAILLGQAVKIEVKADISPSPMRLWPYIETDATVGNDFNEPSPLGPYMPTTSDVDFEWGSAIHIWLDSLTVADVKNSNFGAGMDGINDHTYDDADINVSVDHMQVKVFYIENNGYDFWIVGANSTNVSGNSGLTFSGTSRNIKKISGNSIYSTDKISDEGLSSVKKLSGVI